MADIKKALEDIKNALFGRDVRSSIHDGIDAINKEVESTTGRQVDLENTFDQLVINAGNNNAEIVDARVKNDGTSYSKLGDRLNEIDSQLAQSINKMDNIVFQADNSNIDSLLSNDNVLRIKVIEKIINKKLVVPSNKTIYGDKIIAFENCNLQIASNSKLYDFDAINTSFTFNTAKNILMQNIHNEINTNILMPFRFIDSSNIKVENVSILREYGGRCFSIERCSNLTLDNAKFTGKIDFGINVFMENETSLNENINIKNVEIYRDEDYTIKSGDEGIYAHGFDGLYIYNCKVKGFSSEYTYDFKIRNAKNCYMYKCYGTNALITAYDSDIIREISNVDINDCFIDKVELWQDTMPTSNLRVNNLVGDVRANDAFCTISGYVKNVTTKNSRSKIINAYVDGNVNNSSTAEWMGVSIFNSRVVGNVYVYNSSNNEIINSIIGDEGGKYSLKIDGTTSTTHKNNLLSNSIFSKGIFINTYGNREPITTITNCKYESLYLNNGASTYIYKSGVNDTSTSSALNGNVLTLKSEDGVSHSFIVTSAGDLQKK